MESRGDAATQTATREWPDVRSMRISGSSAPSLAARSDKHPPPNMTPLLRQIKSQHVQCAPFVWRWWERRRSRALRFRLMTRFPSRATNTSPYGKFSKSSGESTSWRRDHTDVLAVSTTARSFCERVAVTWDVLECIAFLSVPVGRPHALRVCAPAADREFTHRAETQQPNFSHLWGHLPTNHSLGCEIVSIALPMPTASVRNYMANRHPTARRTLGKWPFHSFRECSIEVGSQQQPE